MASDVRQSVFRVMVSDDKMSAQLVLPSGLDVAMPECEELLQVITESDVAVSDAVHQRLDALLAATVNLRKGVRWPIAQGRQPVHGEDGSVEWLVQPPEKPSATGDGVIDYYNQSPFITVSKDQVIGKVHPPTQGKPGVDVTGRTLNARDGKECRLVVDDSIVQRSNGDLVAQRQGIFVNEKGKVSIHPCLAVDESVDFSTGNIDFDGDVQIKGGVCDCFVVKATGNVEVQGLIQAATIDTKGDLIARGGFAGRERGKAVVGGNLNAKYLDSVEAQVQGNLHVDREMINCRLQVGADVDLARGAIIGGKLAATGTIRIGVAGSAAAVPTTIHLGALPKLDPLAEQLALTIHAMQKQAQQLQQKQKDMIEHVRNTPGDQQYQQEVIDRIGRLSQHMALARATQKQLRKCMDAQRKIELNIERKLFAGVLIRCEDEMVKIERDLRGPLKITQNLNGKLVCQQADGARQPLNIVASDKVVSDE